MPISLPRRTQPNDQPREMVRVQLKPNDMRSYTRQEAEELIAATPGAYIVGEQDDADDDGNAEAPSRSTASNRSRSTASNRSRSTRSAAQSNDSGAAPAAEKTAETKSE